VAEITQGKGVDVVYDSVGQATFMKSLDCLRPIGMLVCFGQASGPVPPFEVGVLGAKGSLFLTRPSLAHYAATREDLLACANELFEVVEEGIVKIEVKQTYPLAEAARAHRDLEGLCLERELAHFKRVLELKYVELVYYGLWYSPLRRALDAFMESTQQTVTGTVRVKLHKGNCVPVGRRSPYSPYRYELATYDQADRFDQSAAKGFIQLWGLSARIAEQVRRESEKE